MSQSVQLTSLRRSIITEIVDLQPIAETERLKSLGFVPGQKLQVLRTGKMLLVKLGGSSIGISKELAKTVYVRAETLQSSVL